MGGANDPAVAAPVPGATSRLAGRIGRRRGHVGLCLALAALVAAFSAVSIGALLPVLDVLLAPEGTDPLASLRRLGAPGEALADLLAPHVTGDRMAALGWILGALVALTVVKAALAFAHDVAAATLSQRVQLDLAEDLFDRLTGHDEATLSRLGMGGLSARFTYDLDMAGKAADTFVNTLAVEPLSCAAYFAVALCLSWKLTLVAVILVPLFLLAAAALGRRTRRSAEGMLEKRAGLLTHVQETLAALPIVQVYGREDAERRRFRGITDRVRSWGSRLARLQATSSPAMELAGLCALAPVLLYGGHLVLVTRELAAAEFLGVFVALISFYGPLRKSIGAANRLQGGVAGAARIFAAIDLEPAVRDRAGAGDLPPLREAVAWRDVTVVYPDGREGLRGATLTAPARRTTAVVGPSGSGKTTLLFTLPRLLDPDQGAVLLDGRDVRDATLASLRRRMALVTQEPRLFAGTLAENVAYSRPGATRAEVETAGAAARVDEIVARLPRGWDTVLDERGSGLSGGERQRVAIARAVLRDPEILLLDEPTSSLDPENERLVRAALETLCRGRTTIVVAHRPETARAADHVVVLRDGLVEAEGPPEDVERRSGTFRELFGAPRSIGA